MRVWERLLRMKVKSWLLICLAALMLPVGGCGFVDIDKRFFIVAVALDKTENKQKPYRITVRLAIPSSKVEPGADKSQVESIEAAEISEGIRMLKSFVDKELDLGHCKIFILGKTLSRDDITDSVNWMMRRRDIQASAFVAMADDQASDIVKKMPQSERYSGNTLFLTFGEDGTRSSYIRTEHLYDLQRRISERGMDPYLPLIKVTDNGYEVDRLALLDKKKVRAMLTQNETQLFNQLDKQYLNSIIKTKIDGAPVVLTVTSIAVHYSISSQGVLKMKINVSGTIEEGPQGIFNNNWSKVEKAFQDDLSKQSLALLQKIQKSGVDPFGFGMHYRATHFHTNDFEVWQQLYPKLEFAINSVVKIQGTGLTK